ncbi:MAG: alkaline phosphatase PhoX [Cyanobacteriota bacterium]|nr:alkaline phosphatase PhoX [Cyanobacteriota bacterium]
MPRLTMNRRWLLLHLLGFAGAGLVAPRLGARAQGRPAELPFEPVALPLPWPGDGLPAAAQRQSYGRSQVADRLVLPPGYRADVLATWGETVGQGRFGFNNDFLACFPQADGRALLTVNFEYISFRPWREGLAEVVPGAPSAAALIAELAATGGRLDASALASDHPLGQRIRALAATALNDLGIGVLSLERDSQGRWRRRPGPLDRRITGLSGLEDPARQLRCSGPAAAVFRRRRRLGYDDGLGDRVIGTFANCAGGTTPWGTLLSAEENVQDQVVEAVHADGSSPHPSHLPFRCDEERLAGLGNPFALAGNKYGWMVEVDPARPQAPVVKHSWLGRCRHEAVAVRAVAGQPLQVYSGCDRHGGHLYRFVSQEPVRHPADPANSRLLEAGRLEVARLEPAGADGVGFGRWLPLQPEAPVDPLLPSHFERHGLSQATLVPHGDRRRAGGEALASDAAVVAYRQRYRRLADLYPGDGEERMGAILIDAHLAASAIGATACARPEDTDLDPRSGALLVAFTAGGSDGEGTADPAIFRGPAGEPRWPYGWVMRLEEQAGDRFRWRMVATGGLPWQGGLGFANPDNLAFDAAGNLWMATDRSGSATDVFGNNSCWLFPADGAGRGQALPFALAPMESELCGPCLDQPGADGRETTLFLAVQHPGETHGTRRDGAEEIQAHPLVDRNGQAFEQLRSVPLGSNWPSGVPGRCPRPGVVAISRQAGGPLLG